MSVLDLGKFPQHFYLVFKEGFTYITLKLQGFFQADSDLFLESSLWRKSQNNFLHDRIYRKYFSTQEIIKNVCAGLFGADFRGERFNILCLGLRKCAKLAGNTGTYSRAAVFLYILNGGWVVKAKQSRS